MNSTLKMVRVILSSVTEGDIKRFSASGRSGESFTNREYMQHYGFTSLPLQGAEGILLIEGNRIYLVASDDRRYRISLQDGEVAIYTDEGDKIHLKRGNEIEIFSSGKVAVTAPEAEVNASISAKVVSPIVQLGQAAGHKLIVNEDFLTLFNNHTHSGGATPDQQAGAAHKTVNVKAT